jgi:hypothetical protein
MGKAGKITYKDMLTAFRGMTKEGGKFFNASKRYSMTLDGVFKGFQRLLGSVGNSIRQYVLPPLEKLLSLILKAADWFNTKINPTMKAVIFYMLTLAGILPLLIAGFGLLNAEFLLIAGVILLASAAIALLVEDFILYTQGQESMFGKILPPWDVMKGKIVAVRDAIVNLWESTAPTLIDMKNGWVDFLEYVGAKLHQVTKEGSGFRDVIKWIGGDIVNTFENIKQLFAWIENSAFWKWYSSGFKTDFNNFKELMKENMPKVGNFLGNQLSTMLPSYQPALSMAGGINKPIGGVSTQKNINVDSTINVSLPAGTPEFHKMAVQESAKQAVYEVWNYELRNLLSNQPESE